ncbi:Ku protein [Lichenicola cladoniae]|uniref:Non-homologous end joining protein Ku n=1 Tax=Lichenicola cladoniae TaxID=1484109 RepID=A0A6M8HHU5_9PROT|nr:Ku protein [Lichenicola cladoniae]NPD68584.1 Ku protein [Acetobacteraceae bacterium]QKE88939.1 Ku protein [Lichenicola cladoniae]
MADRPIWRGQLRLALVSCPIALYSVRQPSQELHFHFINPKTGNRVRMVTQDSETDEELSRKDLQRGYEFKKDHYVLLDDEDFERARIDSSSVLSIDKFVRADSIDPIYFDSSYYLVPDGSGRDAADDVFVVLREAIAKTGRVALSRLVMSRRERAVALMPMGRGIVLHTLNDTREITAPDKLFEDISDAPADTEMVALAVQLIDRQTAKFQPGDMEDRYEARLREVIDAKLAGEDVQAPSEEPERDNVVDLMSALRKSLGEPKGATGGKTASDDKLAKKQAAGKAPPKKPAPRRKTA